MICFHSQCTACKHRKSDALTALPAASPLLSLDEANRLISVHTAPLAPGTAATELVLAISGVILNVAQESNSLLLLVIGPEGTSTAARDRSCVDVLVKAGEGLTVDDIRALMAAIQPQRLVQLRGYPEAFSTVHAPPRSDTERSGFLHCRELLIGEQLLPAAPPTTDQPAAVLTPTAPTTLPGTLVSAAVQTEGSAAGSVSNAAEAEDVPSTLKPRRRRTKAPKKDDRFAKFASFMVAEHGHEVLSAGTGVMDVAGGCGRLAYELCVRRGVPCCVLDPKTPTLHKRQWTALTKRREVSLALAALADRSLLAEEISSRMQAAEPKFVEHYLSSTSWQSEQDQQHVQQQLEALYRTPSAEGAAPAVLSGGAVHALLQQASVVVGLHPDQATEPIIDVALALGKPAAVVPCCIFPTLFNERRTRAGNEVRRHDDFVEYLVDKDESAQHIKLEFDGRNDCVTVNWGSNNLATHVGPQMDGMCHLCAPP